MKRRNFLKTCAVGMAAGPITVVMSGEATGKTMHDPFFEYVTVPFRQLIDEAHDLKMSDPSIYGRYSADYETMSQVMRAHVVNARKSGRMVRVTVPADYYDEDVYPRVKNLPLVVTYMSDRIDIIHETGYIETIKDRQKGAVNGIGGRVV